MKRNPRTFLLIFSMAAILSACNNADDKIQQENTAQVSAITDNTDAVAEAAATDNTDAATGATAADNADTATGATTTDSAAGSPNTAAEATATDNTAANASQAPSSSSADGNTDIKDDAPSYYGSWKVTPNWQSANVSALTTEEIESFFGSTITYQADAVLLNGQEMSVDDLTYTTGGKYTYDSLLADYHANLGEWWNGITEVSYISIPSGDFFGSDFFIASDYSDDSADIVDALWIWHEGVFFFARRING